MADDFSAPGVVAPAVSRTVHVYSLANGLAVEVPVQLGQHVQKGQVLAVVSSPDLASAIDSYLKAKADKQVAAKELVREQDLYAHGATPQRALQLAQDAYTKAEVDERTAAEQIQILGGDLHALSPRVTVRSPVSGTIIEQKISEGEAVSASAYLFTVANLSQVWVLCNVYEDDLSKVSTGDLARITLSAYPGVVFRGVVSNISRVLDPATRTATVRVVLNNGNGLLKPEMFTTVRFTSRTFVPHTLVPASALFQLHDRYWVFVPAGPGEFRRVPVEAGEIAPDGWQEVLSGLRAGQEVVENSLQFANTVSIEKE